MANTYLVRAKKKNIFLIIAISIVFSFTLLIVLNNLKCNAEFYLIKYRYNGRSVFFKLY